MAHASCSIRFLNASFLRFVSPLDGLPVGGVRAGALCQRDTPAAQDVANTVTTLLPVDVAVVVVDGERGLDLTKYHSELRRHQSRRRDSNSEPPDYKIRNAGVSGIWLIPLLA